jgi:hypothetical protein
MSDEQVCIEADGNKKLPGGLISGKGYSFKTVFFTYNMGRKKTPRGVRI